MTVACKLQSTCQCYMPCVNNQYLTVQTKISCHTSCDYVVVSTFLWLNDLIYHLVFHLQSMAVFVGYFAFRIVRRCWWILADVMLPASDTVTCVDPFVQRSCSFILEFCILFFMWHLWKSYFFAVYTYFLCVSVVCKYLYVCAFLVIDLDASRYCGLMLWCLTDFLVVITFVQDNISVLYNKMP